MTDLDTFVSASRLADGRVAFIHRRDRGAVLSVRQLATMDLIEYAWGYRSLVAAHDALAKWNPHVSAEPEGWEWAREGDE